jgi:hypothetical protein
VCTDLNAGLGNTMHFTATCLGSDPLNQHDLSAQTNTEFMTYVALTAGGVMVVLLGAFGLVRSSRK